MSNNLSTMHNKKVERLQWIDISRGLFMLIILWFHTEVYYFGECKIPYSMYVQNALAGFFFLSGYLYIPKIFMINKIKIIHNIFRKLVIPYIIFTFFIGIAKVLFRGENIELLSIITNILTGNASWFISALIICQLYLVAIQFIVNKQCLLLFACILPFLYMVFTKNYTNLSIIDGTSISVMFMYLGFLYKTYEKFLDNLNIINYIFMTLILIILKVIEYYYNYDMIYYYISIDNYLLFIFDTFIWCIIIIKIIKKNHSSNKFISIIEWIGKHSLVFYFLCGGVPSVVSTFANNNINYKSYTIFLFVFLSVLIITSFITYLLYNIKIFRKIILYVY